MGSSPSLEESISRYLSKSINKTQNAKQEQSYLTVSSFLVYPKTLEHHLESFWCQMTS